MSNRKHRIFLVEPSEALSCGFSSLAESSGEFSVVATSSSLSDKTGGAANADIIVVNPVSEGFDNLEKLKASHENGPKVVILAHENYPERFTEPFDGVISIYDSKAKIIKKLRAAANAVSSKDNDVCELSSREKEILSSVAKGLTNKEIAEKYFISVNTVMTHRRNITAKLGINSISGLTVYAVIHGLIEY